MTFGRYLTQWIIVTVVAIVLAFLCTMLFPTRTLWPFAVAFLYIGVLILLLAKALIQVCCKKD